jgi:hypothetical protein
VTNVAYFNILIAIVGDTYDRITDKKEIYRMIEQVEITTEFIDFIEFEQEFIDYDYIYLLEVKEEDEINMDWAGKLSSIKNSMKT